MSFFFRKRTPRGPPPAHCKTCKARLDACECTPTEESYEERRARTPPSREPRLDAAAERRLASVYAAYVDDAARADAGARLQESDAPPIAPRRPRRQPRAASPPPEASEAPEAPDASSEAPTPEFNSRTLDDPAAVLPSPPPPAPAAAPAAPPAAEATPTDAAAGAMARSAS